MRVPFILDVRHEEALYAERLREAAGGRHIAPHTAYVAALWAVLSRMRKPQIERFPSTLAEVIGKLTPIEKVELYSTGQVPEDLVARSRARARGAHQGAVPRVRHVSDLRGPRRRVAARDADRAARGRRLDPLRLRVAARRARRDRRADASRSSLYEFLRQDVQPGGYHDHRSSSTSRAAGCSTRSTTRCASRSGSSRRAEYARVFERYVSHVDARDQEGKGPQPADRPDGRPRRDDDARGRAHARGRRQAGRLSPVP